MKKEKNNFARAVDWLRLHGKIKNQKELAERIGVTETTITRIKNGQVRRPDEDTLYKFSQVFGDIINIAYLRYESKVMLVVDLHDVNPAGSPTPSAVDALTAALLAEKDARIADLKRQLADTIADKDRTIAANEALIKNLQQTVADLRAKVALEKGLSTGRSHSESAEPQPAL